MKWTVLPPAASQHYLLESHKQKFTVWKWQRNFDSKTINWQPIYDFHTSLPHTVDTPGPVQAANI